MSAISTCVPGLVPAPMRRYSPEAEAIKQEVTTKYRDVTSREDRI